MKAHDFKLDTDGDIAIENGDFVIVESDQQHIKDIMESVGGWFKKFPLVGLNPYQYLNARVSATELNKNAKIQLQADGYADVVTDLSQDSSNKITGTVYGKRP